MVDSIAIAIALGKSLNVRDRFPVKSLPNVPPSAKEGIFLIAEDC